jgi:hypothetical protein
MRRSELQRWVLSFLERHASESLIAQAEELVRELPGVVVDDEYLLDMDEMLGMHATMLEAQFQATQEALKEAVEEGAVAAAAVVAADAVIEKRTLVADLRISIEERFELRCPECGTAPPATVCKMSCETKKWKDGPRS